MKNVNKKATGTKQPVTNTAPLQEKAQREINQGLPGGRYKMVDGQLVPQQENS